MAGRGPAPKDPATRRNRIVPTRGEWQATPGVGWQHGPTPPPPDGLRPGAASAWTVWMGAWFASHWTPDDLPGLYQVARLYDACEAFAVDPYVERTTRKGETIWVLRPNPGPELRQMMDNYGITPKGQQDRRWVRPAEPDKPAASGADAPADDPYAALRVVF